MDPTNNPTPTTPSPEPTAGPAPEPNLGTDQNATPTDSVPVNETATNPTPNVVADGADGIGATAPNPPVGVAASLTSNIPKVNPVVVPGGGTPVNPVVRPNGIGITDPITVPEKPQAPDPVEEELKAPMKAAGPVPGSIGSAVSGPNEALGGAEVGSIDNPFASEGVKQTPSVSFNDPAIQTDNMTNPAGATTLTNNDKKMTNKKTLIALIAVAAVIVVVLIVFLIMQLSNGGGGGSSGNGGSTANNGQSNSQVAPPDDSDDDDSNNNSTASDSDDTDTEPNNNTVSVPAIACTTSYADDSGNVNKQTINVTIEDNKLEEIDATLEITDSEGNRIGTSSQAMTIDKLMQSGDSGNDYVGTDGTLFVEKDVLGVEIEKALNQAAGGAYEYDCVTN